MRHTVTATIRPGDQGGYVGECPELGVVTQASTLDEMAANLREAVALALEGEDLGALGFSQVPTVVVMFELEPAVA